MSENERQTQALTRAFETFSAVGAQLADAYQALEHRVERLSRELAEANSERLRQLAEKERLAHRLEQLVEVLPGGMLVLDEAGRVQQSNSLARELFGDDLEGRSWEEVTDAARRLRGTELRLEDGRCFSLSSRALGPGEGRVLLLADVSETRRLQQAVARRQRLSALGEMAARMAHQVRTPLASLLLLLSQLESPGLDPERRRQAASRARERLRHLEQTVNNLLVYARGVPEHLAPVKPQWLAEQFRQILEPRLEAAGGRLETRIEPDAGPLQADPDALLGALVNLGMNALQAGGDGTRLRLLLRRSKEDFLLELEDDGPGIPEALLERVCEPFFTTRPGGTGLGLSVVRAVVEGLGGTLTLENRAGGGLRARIRLPADPAGAGLPSGTRASRHGEIETEARRPAAALEA